MSTRSILAAALLALLPAAAFAGGLYSRFPVRPLVKEAQAPVRTTRPCKGVVLADFGRDAFAQPSFEVSVPKACTVTVRLGEKCSDGRVDMKPGGSVRACSYRMELSPDRGSYAVSLEPDKRNTRRDPTASGTLPVLMDGSVGEVYPFRYLEIEGLPEGSVPVFSRYAVHYPFDEGASFFHCSDTVLNRVWELCKYSVKATSFCGIYVDGDRERIPYEADALINQLSHYGVDAEYAMARRTAEFLFAHPTWPTEWQLQTVSIAWYDYLYTGDKSLICKYYDLLKAKTLSVLREDNGLISTCTGKFTRKVLAELNYFGKEPIKDIVDWPRSGSFGIGKQEAGEADGYVLTDYNTVVNAWHYNSLVLMEKIALALGKRSDAAAFRRDAVAVKEAVNSLLFDEARGCYRDGIGTAHCSLHANMFPLAFGMVPKEREDSVLAFIRSRGMACSVYGAQFLLEGIYDAGQADYALSLMASTGLRSWYNMLRLGSTITLEAWDPCFKSNLDWNHAWGSAPANIIPRKLMGVEPLEPGFRKLRIKPQTGSLREASALVPTIRGGVRCSVSGGNLSLGIPRGVSAEVHLAADPSRTQLFVNGKSRKYSIRDGFAVSTLGGGDWKCEWK